MLRAGHINATNPHFPDLFFILNCTDNMGIDYK